MPWHVFNAYVNSTESEETATSNRVPY